MNAFIFQSTIDRYDLRDKLVPGGKEDWLATRYRPEMKRGDLVYFWLAGDESIRGIYGWGQIVGRPREAEGERVVRVSVSGVFPKPLLATEIRLDKLLSKLLIFKAPQATNFLLSQPEAARLAALIQRRGGTAPSVHPHTTRIASPAARRRLQVFISYSHVDHEWLTRLQVHLAPLVRSKKCSVWDDTRIAPGAKWKKDIKRELDASKVAVLLVSADFLASDFIIENELPPLLHAAADQGGVILPVIAAPCRFRETEALAQYQAVNPPTRPLTAMTLNEREQTFYQVSIAVEGALQAAQRHHD